MERGGSFFAARVMNFQSRQKRNPPETASRRQVTAIHVQGDMTALTAAGGRGFSTGDVTGGWIAIDVMMVTGILDG